MKEKKLTVHLHSPPSWAGDRCVCHRYFIDFYIQKVQPDPNLSSTHTFPLTLQSHRNDSLPHLNQGLFPVTVPIRLHKWEHVNIHFEEDILYVIVFKGWHIFYMFWWNVCDMLGWKIPKICQIQLVLSLTPPMKVSRYNMMKLDNSSLICLWCHRV